MYTTVTTYPWRDSWQIVTSVDRCLYPFILHKSSDELFIQNLSFFLVFWLKLQQIFQRSSPYSRHLRSWKARMNAYQFEANRCARRTRWKMLGNLAIIERSKFKMAAMLWKVAGEGTFLKSVLPCVNLIPVRYKTHRRRPTKKKISPFVQRRTDLIKKLVLALVQHERIQTTDRKAQQLKKYGDLVRQNIMHLRIIWCSQLILSVWIFLAECAVWPVTWPLRMLSIKRIDLRTWQKWK